MEPSRTRSLRPPTAWSRDPSRPRLHESGAASSRQAADDAAEDVTAVFEVFEHVEGGARR